jgi:hypothetical protein
MNHLGAALRAWRDRLNPATVGLAHHAPRRVAGLRRGELAMLAGISAEYVAQLEPTCPANGVKLRPPSR